MSTSGVSQREATLAARNGVKLAGSMFVTMAVAFAVRFLLPRYLGPEVFGKMHFAEAFATGFFVLTSLGFDVYISKEVANRPGHASDFFGGLLLLRVVLSAVTLGIMAGMLHWMGKSPMEYGLVGLFAAWQVAFLLNNTLTALLNANSTVGELALLNILTKLMWGGGIVFVMWCRGSPYALAHCFLWAEVVKAFFLFRVVYQRMGLQLRLDLKATWAVALCSMPYFLTVLISRIYQKLDVSMISKHGWDLEVGWYGAAANVSAIIVLFLPLATSVVLPMSARIAKQESFEAMSKVMRSAVRVVLVSSMVLCLLCVLHAQAIVQTLFGASYAPSARTLQAIAPTFPLTYVACLLAIQLFHLKREWYTTLASFVGLLVNAGLNLWFIPHGKSWLGDGGAGFGASMATLTTEITVTTMMLIALGRSAVDEHFWPSLGKLALACGLVAGLHQMLPALGLWRVGLEVPAYFGLVALLDVPPVRGFWRMGMTQLRQRFLRA